MRPGAPSVLPGGERARRRSRANVIGTMLTAFGLRFRSEVPVPFLPAPRDGTPDVVIRLGAVPRVPDVPAMPHGAWQAAPGVFHLDVDDVARYLVREGREVLVEPAGGSEADVTAFLLGSVLGACLQQRGILTLHASAVETAAGAMLFAGTSGAGKSTLAATLVDRGYRMLADDVTGVLVGGVRPVALSAFPVLRLRADAVELLEWRERTSARVLRGDLEKYVAPVERFRASPLPVHAAFTLHRHERDTVEIEAVPPGAALRMLLRHTYRRRFVHAMECGREHFGAVSALVRRMPLFRVARPARPFPPAALADALEPYLRAAAASSRRRA